MNLNLISATLSSTDRDRALASLDDVRKRLPFLVDLTAEQRNGLTRIGDKNFAFIRKANQASEAHPGALPRQFDEAEFQKDVALLEAMYPVVMGLRKLLDQVEDTYSLVGSEAYAGALVVYRSLRDNDPDGSFAASLDDMAARFERKSRGKEAGEAKPGEAKPGNAKPADAKPADAPAPRPAPASVPPPVA